METFFRFFFFFFQGEGNLGLGVDNDSGRKQETGSYLKSTEVGSWGGGMVLKVEAWIWRGEVEACPMILRMWVNVWGLTVQDCESGSGSVLDLK